jgi:hypothetical protein
MFVFIAIQKYIDETHNEVLLKYRMCYVNKRLTVLHE